MSYSSLLTDSEIVTPAAPETEPVTSDHEPGDAYLFADGSTAELRIPLNSERSHLLTDILEVSGLPSNYVAEFFADYMLLALDAFKEGTDDGPGNLAYEADLHYGEIWNLYTKFHKAGWMADWVLKIFRRDLAAEMAERLEANEFDDFDREWVRDIVTRFQKELPAGGLKTVRTP